jgi:hypothetical protein
VLKRRELVNFLLSNNFRPDTVGTCERVYRHEPTNQRISVPSNSSADIRPGTACKIIKYLGRILGAQIRVSGGRPEIVAPPSGNN